MGSILAIVSKKIFEAARVDRKVPGIGQTWAHSQYVSKVPGLKALESGGALFLCTVRPPDEQLWLVAVLENPVFDGIKWSSAPNIIPIRDVSALIPELKFTSGTGIKAEPGKLGMSLQTPRQLTEEDVRLLRGEEAVITESIAESAPKKKEAPKKEIPKSKISEAPKTVSKEAVSAMLSAADSKEFFGALDRIKNAPVVAQKAAIALAKKLGQTLEALAVLDYAAEQFLESGKNDQASKAFTAARALEKKFPKDSVTRTNTETLSLYSRFARCGAIDERTISSLGTSLTKAKEPVAIPFAELVAVYAENAPLSILLITAVGKVAQSQNVDVELCFEILAQSAGRHLSAQKQAQDDVWIAIGSQIVKAATESGNLDSLLDLFPDHQALKDPGTWRAVLSQSDGLKHLQKADSKRVTSWIKNALDWRPWPNEDDLLWFESWFKHLGPRSSKIAQSRALDPELLEICLSNGITFDSNAWKDLTIPLSNWQQRPVTFHGELSRLSADPELGPRLKNALKTALFNQSFQHKWTCTPLWTDLAAEYVDFLKSLSEHGTVGAYDMHIKALENSLSDTAFEHVPGLREVVGKMDFARALQNTMNHGIMDEWHWPELEGANARLSEDAGQYNTDGPFPYFVLWHDGKVVVTGPEGIVLEGEFSPPEGVNGFRTMRYVPGPNGTVGDVLFVYFHGSLTTGVWLSNPDERLQGHYGGTWMNAILPESGGLNEGIELLMPGSKNLTNWSGGYFRVLSDGKTAYRTERSKLEAFDPQTGKILQTEIHPFLTKLNGKHFNFKTTTLLPVPAAAKYSPLGQKDGLAGFRSWNDGMMWHGEGINGESWSGKVAMNGVEGILGLFRFPERDKVLPIVQVSGDSSIWLKDGSFPIVPPQHANWYLYSFGAPQWLPMTYWHLLKPADLAGSRALRDATHAQASAILEAARQAKQMNNETLELDQAAVREFIPGFSRTNTPEKFVDVMKAATAEVPGIRAPRLIAGLSNLAVTAARLERRVDVLKEMAKTQGVATQTTGRPDQEFRVIDRLFGQGAAWSKSSTEDQIWVADELLKAPQSSDEPTARNVPQSSLDWLRALAHLRSLAYRVLAPGTPLNSRNMLRELLKLFATTGMVLHPERYRVFLGTFEAWPVAGMTHETGQRVLSVDNGRNRYLIICRSFDPQRKAFDLQILEHSFDGEFKDPPGCVSVKWSIPLHDRLLTRQQIEHTLDVFEDNGAFPPEPPAAAAIAKRTGLLPGSAMMLLGAAWKPWEMKSDVREHLGLRVADVEIGLEELNIS